MNAILVALYFNFTPVTDSMTPNGNFATSKCFWNIWTGHKSFQIFNLVILQAHFKLSMSYHRFPNIHEYLQGDLV